MQQEIKKLAIISAEAHSDDHIVAVEFDAAPWFEKATDEQIEALAKIDWGGDSAADAVAESLEEQDPNLHRLFEYVKIIGSLPSRKDCCGFEVSVDRDSAMEWLEINRPELCCKLAEQGY